MAAEERQWSNHRQKVWYFPSLHEVLLWLLSEWCHLQERRKFGEDRQDGRENLLEDTEEGQGVPGSDNDHKGQEVGKTDSSYNVEEGWGSMGRKVSALVDYNVAGNSFEVGERS